MPQTCPAFGPGRSSFHRKQLRMAKPRLTSRQIEKIKSQLRAGSGVRELAPQYDVHPSTISYHGRGIVPWNARRLGMIGNLNAKKLTDKQRKKIQKRWNKGKSFTALADEFEVHASTIARICKL